MLLCKVVLSQSELVVVVRRVSLKPLFLNVLVANEFSQLSGVCGNRLTVIYIDPACHVLAVGDLIAAILKGFDLFRSEVGERN